MVAARMGSIPDVVTDGVTGFLVQPDEPAAHRCRRRSASAATAALALPDHRSWHGAASKQHFDESRSHRRLSVEIRRLAAQRPEPWARTRVVGMRVRRHLGAAWRRTSASVLRWRLRMSSATVAGALVYHQSHVEPPSQGSRSCPRSPQPRSSGICVTCVARTELVAASQLHGAMLARAPRPADSGRDHLRRRPRQPCAIWRRRCSGASAARPRSSSPERGSTRATRSGGSGSRKRRIAASTHGLPLAPQACRHPRRQSSGRSRRGSRAARLRRRVPLWPAALLGADRRRPSQRTA